MPKKLIQAVGYLRKSTKGQDAQGKQRQEKSLATQKAEIEKAAKGKYKILKWFQDDGVSGWKRGAARPNFTRMLEGAKALGAEAVVVDDMDRFSRAAVDEVQADATTLREAGVRWIATNSQGEFDLGARYDIGAILMFTVAAWAGNDYSRKLSRRVSISRLNAIEANQRPSSRIPFGYKSDGNGGLKLGKKKDVQLVRWIFDMFANEHWSMNGIARYLNEKGTPSPDGRLWYAESVKSLLRRRAYRGDLSYNERPSGKFYGLGNEGQVETVEEINGTPRKLFLVKNAHEPIVDPKLWDKAQRRWKYLANNKPAQKRKGYPLTGVLYCGHCKSRMHGVLENKSTAIYRCSGAPGDCGNYRVRQDLVLPFVARVIGEQIEDIRQLLSSPPKDLVRPHEDDEAERTELQRQREELVAKIDQAEEAMLDATDKRTRQALDKRLTAMRDKLEEIEQALATGPAVEQWTRADLDALNEWHEAYQAQAVGIPYGGKVPPDAHFFQDPFSDEACYLADPRKVNRLLMEIGMRIELWWRTEEGAKRKRHKIRKVRLTLGDVERDVTQGVLYNKA